MQALLNAHTQGGKRVRMPNRSLLAGIIVDASGEPMFAAHATKKQVRYRYYVSRSLQLGERHQASGVRLPAREIEGVVKEQVAQLFDDPLKLASQLSLDISPGLLRQMTERCQDIAAELRGRSGGPLPDIVSQVRALAGRLEVDVVASAISALLDVPAADAATPIISLTVGFRLTRTGNALRLVQGNNSRALSDHADLPLLKQVIQARRWWEILSSGEINIATLARQECVTRSYVSRVIGVAFLARAVIEAILDGRQHGDLDAALLRQPNVVPPCWVEQAAKFLPG